MRVQILKEYVKENFPATPLLDYALEVEKITTSKVLLFQTYIWHFRKHSSWSVRDNDVNCYTSSCF